MAILLTSEQGSSGNAGKGPTQNKLIAATLLTAMSATWVNAGEITLVRSFETWLASPRIIVSTDPAGITYHPSGHLFISDSEINELSQSWNCENIFEGSLLGDQKFNTYDAFGPNGAACPPTSNFMAREPTGITYNWFDRFFYISDDNEGAIFRYNSNFGAPLASTYIHSGRDAEGIASASCTGYLYVVVGDDNSKSLSNASARILVYNSNFPRSPVFVYDFDVDDRITDPEGIAYSSLSNHLFIISASDKKIFEYTLEGNFVEDYDIDHFVPRPKNPKGLTFAPSSDPNDEPHSFNLYIVDAQRDNVPDGIVYEAHIPSEAQPPGLRIFVFTASPGEQQVTLEWRTELEVNNRGFIVERSLQSSGPYVEIASYLTHMELHGQGTSSQPVNYFFMDTSVQNNITYFYRLTDVDNMGVRRQHGPIAVTPPKKEIFESKLFPSFPNPFNGSTTIKFELPRGGETTMSVDIAIYNSLGQLVITLLRENLPGGGYQLQWNGQDAHRYEQASGIYFAYMLVNDFVETQKIVLLR